MSIFTRRKLVPILERVEPALSDNTMIPIMTHFWFLGQRVMAFNDKIAISAELETDFKGAVPGQVLLQLLRATHAIEIKFEEQEKNLLVSAGKVKNREGQYNYKWNLGLLPLAIGLFQMPEPPKTMRPGADFKPLFDGIENCLRSVTSDTTVPDQLGITFIPRDGKVQRLELYSTNDATMSHAVVNSGIWVEDRVILSGKFCEQAHQLRHAERIGIEVREDHVVMKADDTILFGRVINSPQPVDFLRLLKEHLPVNSGFVRHPEYLASALERACVITESTVSVTKTTITIKNGRFKLHSKSDKGVVDDNLKMLDEHEAVETQLNPRLVKNGLEFPRILVTPECLIMRKGDLYYFVAASE